MTASPPRRRRARCNLLARQLGVAAGLTMGLFLVFVACMMWMDRPDRAAITTVGAGDIVQVVHTHYQRKGREIARMCFMTRGTGCVVVDGTDPAFKVLERAVDEKGPYAIGFVEERVLFSDPEQRVRDVVTIDVNGRNVKSFDAGILQMGIVLVGLACLGLAATGWSLRRALALMRFAA